VNGGAHAPATPGNPFDEFRRLLKMSRLCLEGEEMSDDQRDAMCNLGESLGLTGGQAEDLIDEYLEEMASMPVAPPTKAAATPNRPPPKPVTPAPAAKAASVATAPAKPAAPAAPAQAAPPKKDPALEVNLSPAARAMERQKYPNFTNKVGVELLLVPSGRFTMGSTAPTAQLNENPLTVVTLSRYYLSRFPITNIQYEAFDPSHKAKRPPWADDNHPVVYVTWNDADNFCKWLTRREGKIYRLPTEAEWEYAARGEDDRAFPWGEWNPSVRLANFADASTTFPWRDPTMNDGFAESSPVGSYPRGASPFGIEDMAGNVFEWSLDWYEPYKGKELVNPRPGQSGRHRVCRGGSWKSRLSSLRTTARAFNEPAYFSNDFGFRIVCECM
jgi:formylglycine-generating enzyme required for sulfatase activity